MFSSAIAWLSGALRRFRRCGPRRHWLGALAGAAVALSPLLAEAGGLDGAGLFALPPDDLAVVEPPPRPPRPLRLGAHLARSFERTIERAKGLGVAPMILGFDGLGVVFSGRL